MKLLELKTDQRYLSLPEAEKARVVEAVAQKDDRFTGLPDEEKVRVLNHFVKLSGESQAQVSQPVKAKPKSNSELLETPGLSFAEKMSLKILPEGGFDKNVVDNANNFAAGATSMNRGVGNLVAGEDTFKPPVSPTGNPTDKSSFNYIAGQVADPTAWAGLKGMEKLPVVGGMMQFEPLKKGKRLVTTGKNVARGSATGAAMGAASEDGTAKEGAIAGGFLGGALPAVGAGVNNLWNRFKHVIQSPNVASGRFANEVAEHSGKREQIIKALEERNLPFSGTANSGQAAAKVGSPEFAALQEISNVNKPALASNLSKFQEAQRASTLNSIGRGDTNELAAAVAKRASRSGPLYEKARSSVANIQRPKAEVLRLINNTLKKDPYISAPLKEIKKMVAQSKAPSDLISASNRIKTLLGKTTDGKPDYDAKVLTNIKKLIDDKVSSVAPSYGAARESFRELSKPVNQMEVGQLLQNQLKKPLGAGERGAVFARAAQDAPKTLKKATGFPRFNEMGDVLDDAGVSAVDRVTKELMADAAQKQLAQKGAQATARIIGAKTRPAQIPNPLIPEIHYANSVIRFLTGKVSNNTLDALSRNMNNPAKMAELMRKASASERDLIGEAMMRYGTKGAINVGARQGDG